MQNKINQMYTDMKKTVFLAAAIAAVAALWACNKTNPETQDQVSVSPTSVSFEGEGGTLKAAVTTTASTFTVTGNPEWLTVTTAGKEITLNAAANTVAEPRSCNLTIAAGTASCTLAVSQKAGSPYAGYTVATAATMEYMGTILYGFMKPTEEDYGGTALLALTDEDNNGVCLWIYTDLFTSAEEVTLTAGTYTKGADDYKGLKLAAKKLTYMPGILQTAEEDDDPYYAGCYYTVAATGEMGALVDGTIVVTPANAEGVFQVKVDMTDESGNAHKYYYEGEVVIDTEGATYPSEKDRIDVANTVFAADCYYMGDTYGVGAANYVLQLYSGTEEDYATTSFEFNGPLVDYSENIDITGEYATPEEGGDLYVPGTLVAGQLMEVAEGMYWPLGTYIMYSFGDYVVADSYASLILTRQEDGKYTLSGAIMSEAGDMVMFMGPDFTGIHDLEISIIDGSDEGEED